MRYKILALILVMFGSLVFVVPKTSAFDLFGRPCSNGKAANDSVCKDVEKGKSDSNAENAVIRTIRSATDIIAAVAGFAAVLMIMLGGMSYITSGGSSDKLATARNRILYSAIGLMVVVLSWSIIRFIINNILS